MTRVITPLTAVSQSSQPVRDGFSFENIEYISIFHHFTKVIGRSKSNFVLVEDKGMFILHSQYHDW